MARNRGSTSRAALSSLLMLVCFFSLKDVAGCSRSLDRLQFLRGELLLEARKVAMENSQAGGMKKQIAETLKLRKVPAGPDPLHHTGQDPQRPQVP